MADDDDFLDSLETDPPVQPVVKPRPRPAPAPAPVVVTPSRPLLSDRIIWVMLAITVLNIGLFAARWATRHDSGPTPSPSAEALGHRFVPILADTLADGCDDFVKALEAGKSLDDSDKALKARFDVERKAAFDREVGPAIHALQPDGSEITDNAKRNALIDLFAGFAKGLRSGK